MPVFPLFIDLSKKKCVIIGGGEVAARKVKVLLQFGGSIIVVSPKLTIELEEFKQKGVIQHIDRVYKETDIEGAFLVIAATSDNEVNKRIYNSAVKKEILVNFADDPERCTFIFPSVVKRDDLVIGISTSGKFPMMSKYMRKKIEEILPRDIPGNITDILMECRERAISEIEDRGKRKEFMGRVLDQVIFDEKVKDTEEINKKIKEIFREYST